MSTNTLTWIALGAVIPALLVVDAIVMRGPRGRSLRWAAGWSVIWTVVGVLFAGVVWQVRDGDAAEAYLAGFLVEKTLSLDNLAVFAMVFAALRVPVPLQGRLLSLGIVGAVVLRGAAIAAGAALLAAFGWLLYVFGAFLIWTAWRMARGGGHVDLDRSRAVGLVRRVLPVTDQLEGERLLTRVNGRRALTPLALALVLIAMFDVVFAVDSIPAIFGITRDTLIVFAANAFSLLGMRALYGVLSDLLARFAYLQLSLAAVLAVIGTKMLAVELVHVPPFVSLLVIIGLLAAGVIASLLRGPAPVTGDDVGPTQAQADPDLVQASAP